MAARAPAGPDVRPAAVSLAARLLGRPATNAPTPENPTRRRCPYCASSISLADCPIVSTAPPVNGAAASASGVELADAMTATPSPGGGPRSAGGHPLLAPRGGTDPTGRVVPLALVAPHRLSPRRECSACHHLLPSDLDDRQVGTLAVIGAVGAGKTHYIAAAFDEAPGSPLLEMHGLQSFFPEESTATAFRRDYWDPILHGKTAAAPTQLDANLDAMYRPLVYRFAYQHTTGRFRARTETVDASLLVHDLPGEMLQQPECRHYYAPFLATADAMMLLVDPIAFGPVAELLDRRYPDAERRSFYDMQAAMFNGLADELGPAAASADVAIVVTKADLINEALRRKFAFNEPLATDRDGHWSQLDRINDEVQDLLLGDLHDRKVVAALDRFASARFFAVAAIGSQPQARTGGAAIDKLEPMRVLDPLVGLVGVR